MVTETLVIIGGGIAGLSCLESLVQQFEPSNPQYSQIILISEKKLVKSVKNIQLIGRRIEKFDVIEDNLESIDLNVPDGLSVSQIVGFVRHINVKEKTILYWHKETSSDIEQPYDYVCICTGAKPRKLSSQNIDASIADKILAIRDVDSVGQFRDKLKTCRRLLIVGNGGISLELVYKIADCEKVWLIRDEYIGHTYFDSGAAKFLLDAMSSGRSQDISSSNYQKPIYSSTSGATNSIGPSLGPNWSNEIDLIGESKEKLDVIYNDEVYSITSTKESRYPVRVITKRGKEIDCDLVATAIGVDPNNLEIVEGTLDRSGQDEGILIDEEMRTSLSCLYAAGDVVSCEKWQVSELWFQMRLWTQARQMGFYAGRCINSHLLGHDPKIYFNFECFTHCTSFLGYRIILLGRFNAQGINDKDSDEYEVVARINPPNDYVKALINGSGRIVGAVLVGNSGLEETIENLVYDQIDVSPYKDHLLDDTVDIEDYFD